MVPTVEAALQGQKPEAHLPRETKPRYGDSNHSTPTSSTWELTQVLLYSQEHIDQRCLEEVATLWSNERPPSQQDLKLRRLDK